LKITAFVDHWCSYYFDIYISVLKLFSWYVLWSTGGICCMDDNKLTSLLQLCQYGWMVIRCLIICY